MSTPAELAAERLAWKLETRHSVEIRVVQDMTSDRPSGQPSSFDSLEEHFIETSQGQRLDEAVYRNGHRAVNRMEHFSDGSRFADVLHEENSLDRQKSAVIKRSYWMEDRSDRMERPYPLMTLHVGRERLDKALPKSEYLGEAEVIGRKCDVFLFRKVKWFVVQDQVYTLDRETSIPLKVEGYFDDGSRSKGEPMWAWTAESLDKIEGHHIPLKSKLQEFDKNRSQPMFSRKFVVSSASFNKDYPPSTFWPVFQPGLPVLDAIENKTYQTPGTLEPPKARSDSGGSGAATIQAVAPFDWSSVMPSAMLGLGLLLLVAGGLAWRKSRR